ncbi:WD40 repeat-like protein [Trametes sanguinea]|nr:WD40 repeat-like protein [Trametes sanguinea]
MVLRYEEAGRLVNGHDRGITSVAFSPGGSYLATAGLDGKVCVWDVSATRLLYSFEGESPVLSIVWLPPADNLILGGFQDGSMAILRITPSHLHVSGFWAHAFPVECLAIRPGDNCLASGAHREVLVWQWNEQEENFTLDRDISNSAKKQRSDGETLVTSIQWTSSSQHAALLLVTYMYHGLVLFDASDWSRIRTIPLQGQIAKACLSDDGTRLAISNVSRGFDVYSMQSGAPLCAIEQDNPGFHPLPVLFIHGGLALVGGSVLGELNIWDVMDTESGTPSLNTPESDDLQPRVIDTLRIPKRAKILAISVRLIHCQVSLVWT